MPQHMHVVIASRIKPKFPIAELRVKNQLIEINASDLAFSDIESETFLCEVMGLDLTPEEMGVLIRTTEGWVTGLQMAALSISINTECQTGIISKQFVNFFDLFDLLLS
jgi:LuxR family maltose regulon positive regulatory protein